MKKSKKRTNKGKIYQKPISLFGRDETDVLTALLNTPPTKTHAKKPKVK